VIDDQNAQRAVSVDSFFGVDFSLHSAPITAFPWLIKIDRVHRGSTPTGFDGDLCHNVRARADELRAMTPAKEFAEYRQGCCHSKRWATIGQLCLTVTGQAHPKLWTTSAVVLQQGFSGATGDMSRSAKAASADHNPAHPQNCARSDLVGKGNHFLIDHCVALLAKVHRILLVTPIFR
jgi:hypothetical protein